MSLAANGSQAYPPPDLQVRHWFEIATDPSGSIKLETVQKKCHSFVYALMTRAKEELEFIANELKDALGDPKVTAEDRIRLLSSTFRNKLSEGGTFDKHGPHRIKFYEDVVNLATKYVRGILPATPSKNERSLRSPGAQFIFSEDPENPRAIATAAEEVIAILDPDKKCLQQPLVIICWDESHSLTDEIEGESWTRFSELRRALRTIKDAPIFSVFLSTAGKFHLFSPDIQFESSNRITTLVLHRFSPITEVGFDEFAVKVKPNGMSTLTQIASTHHMAHLGRALFATRYDCGDQHVKKSIIEFAQVKVLCRKVITGPLQTNETLACLAIRLGLEFKSTSWVDRKAERAQVERHMRLCLAATPGFHNMVTISPSEPLLAEAAFLTMNDHLSIDDAPTQLLYHINWSYLDPGNKGEVVAALLLLLARDKAISRPNRTKPFPLDNQSFQLEDDGATHGRIITVSEFLDALLPTENTRSVKDQKPSRYRRGHGEKKLEDAFANGYIWFNHFVKVNDFLMVNRQYLWCLISRGAAVICANNHEGIDLLIPILFGNHLEPKSVSAILIQVKNDLSYTHNVRTLLFDFMDPFKVHFLSKGDTPSFPIIRMVFALASKTATVTRPLIPTRRTTRLNSPDKYTAYDIWVAGATHESFGVISEAGASIYTHLLERSCKIFNGYDLFEKTATSVEQKRDRAIARRKMHPGTATNIEHLQNYIAEIPTLVDLDDNGDEDSEED
ncbi:hypothetical protein CPB84DRAFT_1732264 [Gymnopilus junonius]|uniref:Uncharacterized protein n=1 Tax=Gymnopilus junonius TaxID=109634 RepID=A0A9P5TLY0_GYMJU|nr:hypothetical protein CPB84DRAFT_1732264 [Gymnopilus junonius]